MGEPACRAARVLLATVALVVLGVVIAKVITRGARWNVSLQLSGIAASVIQLLALHAPALVTHCMRR